MPPDGTVRGTFELNTPASGDLRKMREQARLTREEFNRLGDTMDRRVGGRVAEQRLERYSRRLGDMRRASTKTHDSMRLEWTATTRHVKTETGKQDKQIDGLKLHLADLSKTKATPRIDVDGIAEAVTQIELLTRQLNKLSRQRATPRVALGGGFGGVPGGGGGGGGGGRRGGPSGRLRDFRIMGIGAKGLAAGATLGLPAVQAVGGAAVATGGSLGMAGLGAGALGATGALGLGVGALGLMGAGKGTVTALKGVTTAQQAYNKAVQQYGANSKQAQTQEAKWQSMLRSQPAEIRKVSRQLQAVQSEWHTANAPGRKAFADILNTGLGTARDLIPTAARASNRVTRATAREARGFGRFAGGPTGRSLINTGAGIYDENLRSIRLTGQNVVQTFANITRASRPFFREGTTFLSHWTHGWARSTGDIGKTRDRIGGMVDHLKAWVRLGGSAGKLVGDIFGAGAGAGKNGVERFTRTLGKWDQWIRRNPRQVRAFFQRSIDSTSKLGDALVRIAKVLSQLASLLTPVLDRFSQLASLAASLGLAGQPGLLAAGFGAYRGVKGGGGRGGGGAGGAGGGAAGAAALFPLGFGAAAMGRGTGARAGAVGGRGGLAGQRIYGEGFRYGAPVSQLGLGGGMRASAAGGLSRLGMGARLAAMSAGRAYLPIGLAFGGLSAASFPGSVSDRFQAGVSSFSMGAYGMPQTGSALADRGSQNAAAFLNRGGRPPSAAQIRRQMQHVVQTPVHLGGLTGALHGDPRFGSEAGLRRMAGRGNDLFSSPQDKAFANAAKKRLSELDQLRAAYNDTKNAEARYANAQGREKARDSIVDLGKSFDILRRKMSPGRALAGWTKGWMADFKKAGPAGKRQLGRSGAQWVEQMRRNGQLTRQQADRANQRIIRSFRDMGQTVKIINGRVYTGSDREWKNIAASLGSHAEQAREKVSDEFTRIQRMAVHSLSAMGFSAAEAKRLVMNMEKGGTTGSVARSRAHLGPASPQLQGVLGGGGDLNPKTRATGGRVVGRNPRDLRDNVPIGPGTIGAHGELVVNRHTEGRINSLIARHNTTLGGEVRREQRRHSDTPRRGPHGRRRRPKTDVYRRGGRVSVGAFSVGGAAAAGGGINLMGANPGLAPYARLGQQFGLSVSSGARPGSITSSGNVSMHSSGNAIDVSGPKGGMLSYARLMSRHYGGGLDELIHTPLGRGQIKNGRSFVYSGQVAADHYDHVHVGDATPGGIAIPGMGGLAGGIGMAMINLKARKSGLRGYPGAIADTATSLYAAALSKHLNRRIGASGLTGGRASAGGKYDKAALAQLWQRAGGPGGVANLMAAIALAESGGNPTAHNPSGASGLWQILGVPFPGNPMDPMTNARMAVAKYQSQGLGAWEAYTNGNYRRYMARGGRISGGMDWAGFRRNGGAFTTRSGRAAAFVAGEGGKREDVFIRPHRARGRSALSPSGASGGGGGGGGAKVAVNVVFRGPVHVATQGDLDALTDTVAEKVGEKVKAALAGDEVPDEALG